MYLSDHTFSYAKLGTKNLDDLTEINLYFTEDREGGNGVDKNPYSR